MKKIFFSVLAISFIGLSVCPSSYVNAQGVGINPSGSSPNSSAGLDVDFTNKGLLIPRMTTAQRDAISSPPEGLQIFNTNTKCFEAYIYGAWFSVGCPCLSPAAPTAGTHIPLQTQIVWNWNTVTGATGYQWNTTNTYPGTGVNVVTSPSFTQISLTCNTAYILYVWAYSTCGNSSATTLTQTTSVCFICGNTLTIFHTIGAVAPETKTVNYGTVTNIAGATSKCWITRNLGASIQATSSDDNTEAAAGWYWQFNRKQGYKNTGGSNNTPTWTITSINESSDWLAANDPCTQELGSGWRLPTETEWTNVDASGSWSDRSSAYSSNLKLHACGYIVNTSGNLSGRGLWAFYQSSTQNNSTNGRVLYMDGGQCGINSDAKSDGNPVRCIKD